jgi:hypothetical protein
MSEDGSEKMPFGKKALVAAIPAVIALIGVYWTVSRPIPNKDFTGRVMVKGSGAYIEGATVSVEADQGVPQDRPTDAAGIFHVSLPEGTKEVRLRVQAPGYKSITKSVSLTRTGLEDVYLEPEPQPASTPMPQSSPGREKRTGDSNNRSPGRPGSNSNKVPIGSQNREADLRDALNTRGTSPTPEPR